MSNTNSRNVSDADGRLTASATAQASRENRTTANASRSVNEGRTMTAEERRRLLRDEAVQEILPTPPSIPGFHLCWLTTTNPSDPIYRRTKLGYVPVQLAEVPGFDYYRKTGGEYDGCIVCNEMILFKIPQETYVDLMTIYHHDMPNEEESQIREKLRQSVATASTGGEVGIAEDAGFAELGAPKQPIFNH